MDDTNNNPVDPNMTPAADPMVTPAADPMAPAPEAPAEGEAPMA